ncbi:MAG TPA: cyclic nucleotide-binding domain-containing protein [Candidatus Competibacteraceae bacterium]|nr:cyclic nucleotide-binding domain-containing protein [Candidatus Competibacteraceae bacterium]
MPKIVIVSVIGFPEKDRRMIRNILSVASNQDVAYQITDNGGKSTGIFIVNADDPGAMLFWNEYQQDALEANSILASVSPMLESEHVCIKRPLIASQLHGALTLGSAWAAPKQQRPDIILQRSDILRKCFLFRNFSPGHVETIVAMSRIVTLPGNYVVFEKGSNGDEMLVVLHGRLKVSVADGDGKEVVLGTVGPGDIAGEIAMLDGRGRSATVTTLAPSELLVIHRKDFMPFLEQNPKVAIDLIMVLALRLRLNTEQLAELLDR